MASWGRWSAMCLLAAACTVAWPRSASAGSFVGAETFDQGERASYVTVGVPEAEFGHVIGLTSLADVTARARLTWAQSTRVGGLGLGLGTDWRMRFAAIGGWQIAAVGRPDLAIHMGARDHPPVTAPNTSNTVALGLGNPGLVAGWNGALPLQVSVGVHAPIAVFVAPQVSLAVPVYLALGAQATFAGVVPLAEVDLGTTFYRMGGRRDEEVFVRLRLGVGWR